MWRFGYSAMCGRRHLVWVDGGANRSGAKVLCEPLHAPTGDGMHVARGLVGRAADTAAHRPADRLITRLAALRWPVAMASVVALPVRTILGISCLLFGVAMLSCRVDNGVEGHPSKALLGQELGASRKVARWVRTADGWERPDSWHVEAAQTSRLHPLVVAAGQGLAALLALAAFQREES